MKIFSKISVILAGSILLMHSILPHDHHSELNEDQHFEAHETADSLLDFIKLAFHVDLGEDHLESYKVVQQEQLAFDLIFPVRSDILPEIESTEVSPRTTSSYLKKLYSSDLPRHIRLRGPPHLS